LGIENEWNLLREGEGALPDSGDGSLTGYAGFGTSGKNRVHF